MPTPPLPGAILAKIRARQQSVRFATVLREIRQFRAYCCNIDSDYIMGVSKEPVVILDISPNPVCLSADSVPAATINWDFAGSYAPGSSITSYDIDFGDLSSDTGISGSHSYSAAGTYTVIGTVEEGGGLSQSIEIEVNVIDCSDLLLLEYIYASTDGGGVYYWE